MTHEYIGLTIDTVGIFLMMFLAAWVWRVRPQSRLNRLFALIASLFALSIVLSNVGWWLFYSSGGYGRVQAILRGVGGLVLLPLAAVVVLLERALPHALSSSGPRIHPWLAFVIPASFFAIGLVSLIRLSIGHSGSFDVIMSIVQGAGIHVITTAFLYLVVRLAVRHSMGGAADDHLRWQTASIAIALGMWPLFSVAASAIEIPAPNAETTAWDALTLVPLAAAATVWIFAGRGDHTRLATFTGLLLLAVVFAGMAAATLYGAIATLNSGAIGLMRLFGTGLLAFAIVRHQLFDIELKVKWTISRGTLVGIFLAVFFVVGVIAENWLTDQYGLAYGGVAAGLLLFVLNPLQRMADRVADTAMPSVRNTPEYLERRKRDIYLAAVRSAAHDGVVTERERSLLATLADELGLGAKEALDLERRAVGTATMTS